MERVSLEYHFSSVQQMLSISCHQSVLKTSQLFSVFYVMLFWPILVWSLLY